jgi:hypothetical protein
MSSDDGLDACTSLSLSYHFAYHDHLPADTLTNNNTAQCNYEVKPANETSKSRLDLGCSCVLFVEVGTDSMSSDDGLDTCTSLSLSYHFAYHDHPPADTLTNNNTAQCNYEVKPANETSKSRLDLGCSCVLFAEVGTDSMSSDDGLDTSTSRSFQSVQPIHLLRKGFHSNVSPYKRLSFCHSKEELPFFFQLLQAIASNQSPGKRLNS